MDVMPEMTGIEAIEKITASHPGARILVAASLQLTTSVPLHQSRCTRLPVTFGSD
jgi:hypothetical protein